MRGLRPLPVAIRNLSMKTLFYEGTASFIKILMLITRRYERFYFKGKEIANNLWLQIYNFPNTCVISYLISPLQPSVFQRLRGRFPNADSIALSAGIPMTHAA